MIKEDIKKVNDHLDIHFVQFQTFEKDLWIQNPNVEKE